MVYKKRNRDQLAACCLGVLATAWVQQEGPIRIILVPGWKFATLSWTICMKIITAPLCCWFCKTFICHLDRGVLNGKQCLLANIWKNVTTNICLRWHVIHATILKTKPMKGFQIMTAIWRLCRSSVPWCAVSRWRCFPISARFRCWTDAEPMLRKQLSYRKLIRSSWASRISCWFGHSGPGKQRVDYTANESTFLDVFWFGNGCTVIDADLQAQILIFW